MKKSMKLVIFATILVMTLSITTSVFAGNTAAPDPGSYVGNTVNGIDKVEGLGNQIITIISTIGSIVSVIVLVVLGIKYMMGSAEEKAEYKKTLMPYIIGAGLVFAASAIAGIVFSFMQNLG